LVDGAKVIYFSVDTTKKRRKSSEKVAIRYLRCYWSLLLINQYREESVKKYRPQHPEMPEDDLAAAAGFGSVSTMKRLPELYLNKMKRKLLYICVM
jgi:hypothetical protein